MPLKVVKRKGSAQFYLRGTVRGVRVFETTGTDSREHAEALRIRRESGLLDRSVFGPGATVTFPEAASSYIAAGGEAKYLGHRDPKSGKWSGLIGVFVDTALSAIGQAEADEAAQRLCPTAGAATRKRHVFVPLLAVLNHAAAKGWCAKPMIKGPRVKAPVTRWATPEWLKAVLPHCAPRLRRLVVLLVYTGARLSEALRVDWDADVNLVERVITFRQTKNGEMRTAHIPYPLLIELSSVPTAERRGAMFAWSDKSHVHRPLKNACTKASVEYLSPHQLGRHTYATWLRLYAKRDLRGVMQDGGWKSINAVVRYSHVVPGETAKAVDLLPSVQEACTSNVKPIKDRRLHKKLA